MKPILELHVSGLREGETLTFRIEPVAPNAGKPVFLSPAEFSTVSEIIDRASKEFVAELARGPAGDPERLLRGQDQARLNRASSA